MERILFYIGTGAFILLGLIHLVGHVIVIYELQGTLVGLAMHTFEVEIFTMKNSVMNFLNGFSITMAFLMIVFGTMNIILIKEPFRPSVYIYNAFVAGTLCVFSYFWFDLVPLLIYLLIFLIFLWLFINSFFVRSHRKP